ncbi:MAG: DsbC family protein [Rhodanobacter sp.]
MLKKMLLAVCVGGLALNACAADVGAPAAGQAVASMATKTAPIIARGVSPAAEKIVRQAVKSLSANVDINSIDVAPLPGFYQVIASGQLLYVSTDGRYLINGDLFDLSARKNVSDAAWAKFRKAELATVPASARIIYAPANPKYTVTVFTDVNCGFCRALHEHVAAYNKAGIAVEYLAWPREGVTTTAGRPTPTYSEMSSVWCAGDRKSAMNAAMTGHAPAPSSCSNPVKDQFNLGVELGVTGTPMIVGPDGRQLGGYLTPEQLLAALQSGS